MNFVSTSLPFLPRICLQSAKFRPCIADALPQRASRKLHSYVRLFCKLAFSISLSNNFRWSPHHHCRDLYCKGPQIISELVQVWQLFQSFPDTIHGYFPIQF